MPKGKFDEVSPIKLVGVRDSLAAFKDEERLDREWQPLRFHKRPSLAEAIVEHQTFTDLIKETGAQLVQLPADDSLTLDSIYTRDNILVSPKGLILCTMGRSSRTPEAAVNLAAYKTHGFEVAGQITAPGTLEGGDFIWINETAAAVGLGPRTNEEGIRQLKVLLGDEVDLHVVPLPEPDHPDDVLHLMSIISPLDHDLALVYQPFLSDDFAAWLGRYGLELLPLPVDEYIPMGCNVLATAPRQVIMLDKLPKTKNLLEKAGCRVSLYRGDEISRKGEGGPTCLTRPLIRD
ncbi:arginine deiminase family protein [Temperatibacter marinus]|uniref:arginine deiminase n=1 Tax=Temperatibacter marinus TaxID=1456591 RepID=A0AA52EJR3_9PROT|nr:arginine deiminase family protein [Temperatibacter marinus]WND03792.1 arginine deiminase family protein [Temperatibacter marinus]